MELKSLYTVKKILETGSYQKAALALNYAPSTITFQIKQLENELSVTLFEKSGNRMELTQEGREVLPLIDKVLAAADELMSVKTYERDLRGTLTVALPETLVTYQMQPILKEFKEKAPHVRLAIKVMNCYAIYDQMMNGGIDIAIHYDVAKYPQGFTTGMIGSYPLVLVASPKLNESECDFITPNQRKPVCHIQNDPNALYLKIFNRYLKEKNIVLETEMELWSIESIKQSVISNLGVAFLPRFTVEQELRQNFLCEIQTEIPDGKFTAIYVYNKNRWLSPSMRVFLELLHKINQ